MKILVVTGLAREARVLTVPQTNVVFGGADRDAIRRNIDSAIDDETAGIISIGICGGLAPSLAVGDTVLADEIVSASGRHGVDARWSDRIAMRLPKAVHGVIAASDTILTDPAAKAALHAATGALAVDMESELAGEAAFARGLPFAALRVISDAASDALPPAALVAIRPDGTVALGAVLRSLLAQPRQIPGLMKTARDSEIAFARLLRCRDLLGPGLAGLDLG